jgi:uroporphyrinogen-III decarboxylase
VNDRQRILRLLKGEQPDRVPWCGDLTYWAYALEQRGQLPRGFQETPDFLDWHQKLGVGFYLQGYEPYRIIHGGEVRFETQKIGQASRTIIHTPAGDMDEEWTYLPESFASAPTRHLVKGPQDLAALRYLVEHTRFEPNYDLARQRYELIGDRGVVLCYLPKSPFMQLVALWAGIEAVVGLSLDAPEEFAQTLECLEAKWDEAAAIAVASPAECLMIPENLSSEVVGPNFFERYMRRYQEKWVGRIHAAGKFSFIHMDGTLRGLLRQEGSVGFTVLEALTPAPVGDLAMSEMRALAGPRAVLWGGLPGLYFTPLVSDHEFDRLVKEVLEVMRREPRYVLGVADQVPPEGLESRVKRVVELADLHGRY